MSTTTKQNGTGRRKTAVARVRLVEGSGKIVVNGKPYNEFFKNERHRRDIMAPLEATDTVGKYDFLILCDGGGFSGQSGAVVLGIARALVKLDATAYEKILRDGNFLTRDSRMKERKKYGQAAARKRYQFSKR